MTQQGSKIELVCSACGKPFLRDKGMRRCANRYCSPECHRVGKRRTARSGAQSEWWNGGRMVRDGYVLLYMPGHPHATRSKGSGGYINEHVLVAERALGKLLPERAVVHHVNSVRNDNRNSNLVICENDSYHQFLHRRARILEAGGDPNTDKICGKCKQVKRLEEFSRSRQRSVSYYGDGRYGHCSECCKVWQREYRLMSKAA